MKYIKKIFEKGVDSKELQQSNTYLSKPFKGIKPELDDREFKFPKLNSSQSNISKLKEEVEKLDPSSLKVVSYGNKKSDECKFTIEFPDNIYGLINTHTSIDMLFIKVSLYALDLDNKFKDTIDTKYLHEYHIKEQINKVYNKPIFVESGLFPLIVESFLSYFKLKWENVKKFKEELKKNLKWVDLYVEVSYDSVYITFNPKYFPALEEISKDWNLIDHSYRGRFNPGIKFSNYFVFNVNIDQDETDFNRTHFSEGIPSFLQGIGLGYMIYKATIMKVGYISTRSNASVSAQNLWRKLIQDPDLYGMVFKGIENYDEDDNEYDGYAIIFNKNMNPNEIKRIATGFLKEFSTSQTKPVMDKELSKLLK